MKYELIHEVYDLCNGRPDSKIEDIETDNLDTYLKGRISKASTYEREEREDDSVLYTVMTNGQKERYIFSPIN